MKNQKNLSVVKLYFAQCVFNHKILEKAAERLRLKIKLFFYVNLFFLIIGLILIILPTFIKNWSSNIFLIASQFFLVIGITSVLIKYFFAFDKQEIDCNNAAKEFLHLRDLYINLIVDILNEVNTEQILIKKNDFIERYRIICSLSPKTCQKDYQKAQKSLFGKTNYGEEFTWSEEQINMLLPKGLQKK